MGTQSKLPSSEAMEEIEQWVSEYGDLLFRYTVARVSDANLAADLVQTTFLAAITSRHSFQGKSSVKTWLLGILKHKIMDHFRQIHRDSYAKEMPELDAFCLDDFDEVGHWKENAKEWNFTPEESFEKNELNSILWDCINSLPERMRLLFILREIDGESTETICERMGLSVTNFSVMLHRCRHKLRKEFSVRGVKSLKK